MIRKVGRVTLLEYGVRHLPWLPWVTHYTMFHEHQPPDTVVHLARAGGHGPWTVSRMHVSEIQADHGPATLYEHMYERPLPIWMKPLRPLLARLVTWWSGILWKEDLALVERRYRMVQQGFTDTTPCADWVFEEGTGVYQFRNSLLRP